MNALFTIRLKRFLKTSHYHIETRANQWTGFCMIAASIMKGFSFPSLQVKLKLLPGTHSTSCRTTQLESYEIRKF